MIHILLDTFISFTFNSYDKLLLKQIFLTPIKLYKISSKIQIIFIQSYQLNNFCYIFLFSTNMRENIPPKVINYNLYLLMELYDFFNI